jgi:hypothetical protein
MATVFLNPPGRPAAIDDLMVPKARDLARLLEAASIEFATLVSCAVNDGSDVVVFDVEIELPQLRVHPIERRERIAACFVRDDEEMPDALALRSDFPTVPHLNLRLHEVPKSLCLFEQPYRELKRQWTAPRFVERVRTWLALTAKGKLHGDDQPLEPLLWGRDGDIVLPSTVFQDDQPVQRRLSIAATNLETGHYFLLADYEDDSTRTERGLFVPIVLSCPPQPHGIIRFRPDTMESLASLTQSAGLDLLGELRQRLAALKSQLPNSPKASREFLNSRLILLIWFPKLRNADSEPEAGDVWAFLTTSKVRDVGVDIGRWGLIDGDVGHEMTPPAGRTGGNIQLSLLNPLFRLSRNRAAILNDATTSDIAIAAVGQGAIGSNVAMNSARAGYGRWTLIDHDRLYPHNVARHVLPGSTIGWLKAQAIAYEANSLTDQEPAFSWLPVDILKPGDKSTELAAVFANADAIVDMTASVSAARHLAHEVVSRARRLSLFLNPSGHDLVLLGEDKARSIPLDALEMQYYRALVRSSDLQGHFTAPSDRHRFGQSCRDVASRIPQDLVALHGGIGSRAIRSALASDNAQISVWRADQHLAVRQTTIDVSPVTHHRFADWTVQFDGQFIGRLHEARQSKLPNETGGVLIGSIDMERRFVYLVDTIPSPPDSQEWPTLYIRGARGLKPQVEQIVAATDGALHYVGEWHSHPKGYTTAPSTDDMQVFSWLTELMDRDGFPALMMIVGDVGHVSCFLGIMASAENLLPIIAK